MSNQIYKCLVRGRSSKVEHRSDIPKVVGSSPTVPTKKVGIFIGAFNGFREANS